MNTRSTTDKPESKPKITLMMILCGMVGAASASAAVAATPDDAAPQIVVKFDPQNLGSDAGARAVYRQLVKAAEAVCPDPFNSRPFVSRQTEACRKQAIARAVKQIDDSRLAELSTPSSKSG